MKCFLLLQKCCCSLVGAAVLYGGISQTVQAEMTLSQPNGWSGSVFNMGSGGFDDVVVIENDSVETLRGQTFVCRTPTDGNAGWDPTAVVIRFRGSNGDRVLGPEDTWKITIVEWQPNLDGKEMTAWLNGTAADPLSGFTAPNIVMQDTGAFAEDTTFSGFYKTLQFTLDPTVEEFMEGGKVYAIYFNYKNADGDDFPIQGGAGGEKSAPGVMLYQNAGATPSYVDGSYFYLNIHGSVYTPGDGRDLAPQFTLGEDIEVPKNSEPYSGIQATDFDALNDGQSLVGYTVSHDNNALFQSDPAIDTDGVLTFTPATGASGTATISVYVIDDGVTNNQSASQTFVITVTEREVQTIHVNARTPALVAAQDGTSWATAFADLSDALASAVAQDEIWVAAGVYFPDKARAGIATVTEDSTASSFQLVSGVAVYGGFLGTETERSARDPESNLTILSGDVDHETYPDTTFNGIVSADPLSNIIGGNAEVVVLGVADSDAILDGFFITAGYDTGYRSGGFSGGATLRDCIFQGNVGARSGAISAYETAINCIDCKFYANVGASAGVLYVYASDVSMVSCVVQGNAASTAGSRISCGAFRFTRGSFKLVNSLVTGNSGASTGVLIVDFASDGNTYTIENCTLSGNRGDEVIDGLGAGAVSARSGSEVVIKNSILWGNDSPENRAFYGPIVQTSSLVEGVNPGGTNLDGTDLANDPQFVTPISASSAPSTSGGFRIDGGSPAVDAGDAGDLGADFDDLDADGDVVEWLPLDIDGNARVDGTIDMGAYEYVVIRVLTPLESFRNDYGLANDGSEDFEDASGNGVVNIFYFAFNLGDPRGVEISLADLANGTMGLPVFESAGVADTWTFAYVRLVDGADVTSEAQYSTDLTGWIDATSLDGALQSTSVTPIDGDYEFVTLEFSFSDGGSHFFRVMLSEGL